ncbi:hypothetical protein ACFV5J_34050 [Streptomyces zaomyceticus]|uniref:hypothetical protein n=1 Tax=Streptomyces zaomyceticus TaxID=68286 RepID=UPI0036697D4C
MESTLDVTARPLCVLYSALDADIRHYDVVVAVDAVVRIVADLAGAALRMTRTNMSASISRSDEVAFGG